MKVTRSKIIIYAVAVAFLSFFFFIYAVQSLYPSPNRDDFCSKPNYNFIINNSDQCDSFGGKWKIYNRKRINGKTGWCDVNFKCNKKYYEVAMSHKRNIFFMNLGIGILLFVVAFLLGLEAVSSGLMGGAVMMIIYGSIRYWGNLSNAWRTLMLGVALSVLIWLGYRKLRD